MLRAASTRSLRWASALLLCFQIDAAEASSFFENTYVVNVTQRTRMSDLAWNLGQGGYELATGERVDFMKWYRPKWIDLEFHFMTQIHENVGVLWGFSTGEWGNKYTVYPTFKIGILVQRQISPSAFISVSATRYFGQGFEERACVADYGEIGGVQKVNCRLAAAPIEPADTLNYLVKYKKVESWVGVRYRLSF